MKQVYLITLSLLLLNVLCGAQDKEQKSRHFRILSCFYEGKQSDWFVRKADKSFEKVKLSKMNFSPKYPIEDNTPIELGYKDDSGTFQLIEAVSIDQTVNDAILIFGKMDKESKNPSTIDVVNFNQSLVDPGKILVVNLSNNPISGHLGEQTIEVGLEKDRTAIIDAKEVSDENQTFRILWKFMVNQKWRPLSNSTWNYNPKQRQLAIVAEVSDLGRIRILSFSEQIK